MNKTDFNLKVEMAEDYVVTHTHTYTRMIMKYIGKQLYEARTTLI